MSSRLSKSVGGIVRAARTSVRAALAALTFAILAPVTAGAAGIDGTPGKCTGKFVNPITDICWE